MRKKLNIGYDYDMTLADTWGQTNPIKEQVQAHCVKQVKDGHNVFFITKRCEDRPDEKDDVMALARKLGVPKENVVFTCFKDKVKAITENQIDVFLEDDITSIMEIKTATFNTAVVCVYAEFNKGKPWEGLMDDTIKELQVFYGRTIHVASDHGGFKPKGQLRDILDKKMDNVNDYGCLSDDSCDYPNFAHLVAKAVDDSPDDVGILFCSTGQGMSMTANKYPGVRAALCWAPDIARLAREHNDANVLCVPSKHLTPMEIEEIVYVFLTSHFEGGRHQRRVDQIKEML